MVEKNVAIRVGIKILAGLRKPIAALSAITDRGIMVSPEVFITRKVICALDAVSLSGFKS